MKKPSPPNPISAVYLRHHLGQIIHQVLTKNEAFILEKNDIPVMVLISLREYQTLKETHEKQAAD